MVKKKDFKMCSKKMCIVVKCPERKKWFLFVWVLFESFVNFVRYGAVVREAHLAFRSTQDIFIPPTVRPSPTENLAVECAQHSRCRLDTRLGQVCTVPCLGRTEKHPPPAPLPRPSRREGSASQGRHSTTELCCHYSSSSTWQNSECKGDNLHTSACGLTEPTDA